MKITIIGPGRLGKLITKYLSQDFEVTTLDQGQDWSEIAKADVVIPCVPISAFEEVIKKISPLLKEGALVADVCSVKEHPVSIMQNLLPKHVQVLATHPMFGPDSAGQTLWGSKIVLCPIRVEQKLLDGVTGYLKKHGLKVIQATPEEHDRQISKTLVLTHLIGRTLMDMKARPMDIDTKGYRRLMRILETVENDSFQLFQDMNDYNRFAKDAREDFLKSMNSVIKKVKP